MKIAFFGSSGFSIPILKTLLDSYHQIVLIVTTPPSKKGRGQILSESEVEEVARNHNIHVIAPTNLRTQEVQSKLKEAHPECLVVASYGKMIPNEVLNVCEHSLNIHPSLLPKYRGASPIVSQLLDGVTKSGVSIARITEKLDAGDVLSQEKVELTSDDNAKTAEVKLVNKSSALLLQTLEKIQSRTFHLTPQDSSQSSYVTKLTKEMGKIDWQNSAEQIHNQIRALIIWPTACAYWKGKRIRLLESRVLKNQNDHDSAKPGSICEIKKNGSAIIQCNPGRLELILLQPESGKPMSPHTFSIGNHLTAGDLLE